MLRSRIKNSVVIASKTAIKVQFFVNTITVFLKFNCSITNIFAFNLIFKNLIYGIFFNQRKTIHP